MGNPKITLAIFGNQNSNSGFQPLYWINNPPRQLENLVPAGMEENPFFFVLETMPTYTQYTLIRNHVSSYMSVRAGVLKIAITIPALHKVAGDVSPYTILLQLQDAFIRECMTQKTQLSNTLNFKEELADDNIFSDIVDSYELVPIAAPQQRPMTGTADGVVLLPAESIAKLFKCVQYKEFETCKKVIVAEKGKTELYRKVFTNLQIPLELSRYEVRGARYDNSSEFSRKEEGGMRKENSSASKGVLVPRTSHLEPRKSPRSSPLLPRIFDIAKLVVMPLAAFAIGLLCTWAVSLIVGKFTGSTDTPVAPKDSITKVAPPPLPIDSIKVKTDSTKVKADSIKSDTVNQNAIGTKTIEAKKSVVTEPAPKKEMQDNNKQQKHKNGGAPVQETN